MYELGQRANQEDSLFPAHQEATDQDRLFIVCDGMGGHSAGEVASSLVCEAMSKSVLEACPDAEGTFSDADFKDALSDAYDALDKNDNGDVKKMGTTMTFLKFHQDGATIAHIGDSRVYHVRPGADMESTRILFQTSDHSLVNDLVKIGEMTPEEAKVSSQKNVITRAMQPNLERRPSADIHQVSDIKPGDYFFMCTDGILEHMEDENVQYIFSDATGDLQKKAELIVRATAENRDNHTAYLIQVADVEDTPVAVSSEAPECVADAAPVFLGDPFKEEEPKKSGWTNRTLLVVTIILLAAVVALVIFGKDIFKDDAPKADVTKEVVKEEGSAGGAVKPAKSSQKNPNQGKGQEGIADPAKGNVEAQAEELTQEINKSQSVTEGEKASEMNVIFSEYTGTNDGESIASSQEQVAMDLAADKVKNKEN